MKAARSFSCLALVQKPSNQFDGASPPEPSLDLKVADLA